jgi:hypothetical protein
VGALLVALTAMLVHRLAAVRLGTPLPDLLVADSIITVATLGTGAVLLERGLAWAALIAFLAAVAGACAPTWALPVFSASSFAVTAALVVVWGRSRS